MNIDSSALMVQQQILRRNDINNSLQSQVMNMAKAKGQQMVEMMEAVPPAPEPQPGQRLGVNVDTWA
jgi:hypothetical protein